MKIEIRRPRATLSSLAMAGALLVAGCGGGDGNGSSNSGNSSNGNGSTSPSNGSTSAANGNGGAASAPVVGALQLSWQAPGENTDGTTLEDLAGYRVYYGTASGAYTGSVTVADPSAVGYTVDGLPAGTYFAVVRSYNAAGTESDASAEVSKSIR